MTDIVDELRMLGSIDHPLAADLALRAAGEIERLRLQLEAIRALGSATGRLTTQERSPRANGGHNTEGRISHVEADDNTSCNRSRCGRS